jgi:hypothetical protein
MDTTMTCLTGRPAVARAAGCSPPCRGDRRGGLRARFDQAGNSATPGKVNTQGTTMMLENR